MMVPVLLANVNYIANKNTMVTILQYATTSTDPEEPKNIILFFTDDKSSSIARERITEQPEANGACKCVHIFLSIVPSENSNGVTTP